jgi:hypothetical protein
VSTLILFRKGWEIDKTEYKYNVAISFLQQDEGIAAELNDLLKQTMSTFMYTERQEEVGGTDGEKILNEVFGGESRIVAVVYRNNWGQTPWTRIEETAIRNRAYNDGYDFTTFIVLEEHATLPKWLPKNRIWIGFERFGLQGAASVIEARVQEAGGKPKKETAEEHAQRIERKIEAERARAQLLGSEEGVKAALETARNLFGELEKICKSIEVSGNMKFKVYRTDRMIKIYDGEWTLDTEWSCYYGNTLRISKLMISVWNNRVGFPDFIAYESRRLEDFEFDFDVVSGNVYCWNEVGGKERSFSTKQLAEFSMKVFMDKISEREIGRSRERLE